MRSSVSAGWGSVAGRVWWTWITALALVLGSALTPAALAQGGGEVYSLSAGRELALLGGGVVTFGIGQVASARLDVLTVEEIAALDRALVVPRFDAFATRRASRRAQRISDLTGYGSLVLPALLVLGDRPRDNLTEFAVVYAEVIAVNNGLTNLVKNTVRRPRPYAYNEAFGLAQKQVKDARRSFFSGHTSNAAANSFFAARAFGDYYPDSGARPLVWAGAIGLPALTGLTRVLAGKHYWTDVAVGYVVGAAVGVVVPALHR